MVHITQGYSRDHRPDLNQLSFQLITEHQPGIPILMEPLDGNSVDKNSFRDTVNTKAHHGTDTDYDIMPISLCGFGVQNSPGTEGKQSNIPKLER